MLKCSHDTEWLCISIHCTYPSAQNERNRYRIMKKFNKIIAMVLAVLFVAASFAACSSNNEGKEKTEKTQKVKVVDIALSDEEYAFGVDKKQPELKDKVNTFIKDLKSNGKLDEICNHYFANGEPQGVTSAAEDSSKDQLVVATNAEFEPFEYKKGNTFYGIDMEIAKALADSLGKELVIKDMKFDAVVTSVQQQKCDIAMAGLTVNPSRAAQVDFSESYYSASQKLVVKGDDTTFDACKTKEDVEKILNGLDANVKIGGQNGTTAQSYVQGSEDMGFAGLKAQFVGYDNASLAMQDLVNGNLNYVMVDAAPAVAITTAINNVA